ncbi:MAG: YceI family protein [Steroidobacteraceae bacterium]
MRTTTRGLSILSCTALLGALATPALAAGHRYMLDPGHTQVHIWWNHFGFSNPGASFDIQKGTLVWDASHPQDSSVTVTIPVASVNTQVPALDARFKVEFFDAAKYPTITFRSTKVQRVGESDHYLVTGNLTVHGVTKPVTLHATLNRVGEQPMEHVPAIGFDATGTLDRSAFGLKEYVPEVSDLVHIRITAEGIDAKASGG